MAVIDKYKVIKNEVIKRIDIVSVIDRYVPLKRRGNGYVGLCPFHSEKTPSFSVNMNENGGYYHCFGCQESGDAFDFIMKKDGLTFNEALRYLAKECGVPWNVEGDKGDDTNYSSRRNLINTTEFAVNFFYDEMTKSMEAIEYFKNRGITGETAREFKLGFAPNSWDRFIVAAKSNGFSEELLLETALAKKNNNGVFVFFKNRVIFPIFDSSGKAVAFGGRAFGDEKPKYLNSSNTVLYDKSRILYGYYNAKKEIRAKRTAVLVEGYMDVISLYQAGVKNVVATCGTSFSEEKAKLLSNVCDKVVIVLDGDDAGIKGAKSAVVELLKFEVDIRYALIPNEMDPDDFVKEYGKESFDELIFNSQDGFSFLMGSIENVYNVNNPAMKPKAVREIAAVLKNVKNNVMLSDYMTKVANRWKVDFYEIKAAMRNYSADSNIDSDNVVDDDKKWIIYTEEGKVIQLFFWYPDVMGDYLYEIPDDLFTEPFVNRIYSIIRNGEADKDNFIGNENLTKEDKNFLAILMETEPSETEDEARVSVADKIRKFKKIKLQKENAVLTEMIREEGNSLKRSEMLERVAKNQKEIAALFKKRVE